MSNENKENNNQEETKPVAPESTPEPKDIQTPEALEVENGAGEDGGEPRELTFVPDGQEGGDSLENYTGDKPAPTTGAGKKLSAAEKKLQRAKELEKEAKELKKEEDKKKKEKEKADVQAKKDKVKKDEEDRKAKEEAERDQRGKTPESIKLYKAGENALALNDVTKKSIEVIRNLDKMSDEQVKGLYLTSTLAEGQMFIIKGAMASEIFNRVKDSKKFMNKAGQGVSGVFNDLAKEIGVDVNTLYRDFKIYEEFGSYLVDLLADNQAEKILPREYYQLAIKTPKPVDTLTFFEEQRESVPGYVTMHAKRDTVKLNSGATFDKVRAEDVAERAEAVKEKDAGKKSPNDTKTAKELVQQMVSLQITKTPQHQDWLNKIVAKYDKNGFEQWFDARCMDEFGEMVPPVEEKKK